MGKRLREMPLIRLRQRALKLLWQLIADQHLTKISVGVFFFCLILKVYRRLTSWRCGQLKSPSWWGKGHPTVECCYLRNQHDVL